MAIYFCNVKIGSRSRGQSAIAAAASVPEKAAILPTKAESRKSGEQPPQERKTPADRVTVGRMADLMVEYMWANAVMQYLSTHKYTKAMASEAQMVRGYMEHFQTMSTDYLDMQKRMEMAKNPIKKYNLRKWIYEKAISILHHVCVFAETVRNKVFDNSVKDLYYTKKRLILDHSLDYGTFKTACFCEKRHGKVIKKFQKGHKAY